MADGISSIGMRTKYWPEPIYIPNHPGIAKHERRTMFKAAMKIAKGSDTFAEDTVILYNSLYDDMRRHLLEIHRIEHAAIMAGKSRAEVIEASSGYVQAVIAGKES